MVGKGIGALHRRGLNPKLSQHQPQRVRQATVGPPVNVCPSAAGELDVEKFELEHCSCSSTNEEALREAWLAADLGKQLCLALAEEFPFARSAIDGVADHPATKRPTMRSE